MTEIELLQALKVNLPEMRTALEKCEAEWGEEDAVYRYFHHSYKVYHLQNYTSLILKSLPDGVTNTDFLALIASGTGIKFEYSHNQDWDRHVQPILTAFWHAKYMLRMAIKYATELTAPPSLLPSGWAAVLYLYDLR